jgi:hypothetical protein
MIASVRPSAALPAPDPWRDVEVVDAVLVDVVAPRACARRPAPAEGGLYDASGRPLGPARFGRLVSVLA